MVERTVGIILRTQPLTETSLIVHWLTRDWGRLHTVAKGARRPKSPFHGKLDLFYEARISFLRSRRSELHVLRETDVSNFHPALRNEIAYLQQAAYFTQLIELMTETDTPIPGVFQLFRDALNALPQHEPRPSSVFAFEVKLLRELGFDPNLQSRNLTSGTRKILNQMTHVNVSSLWQLRLSSSQNSEIGQWLQGLIGANAGRVPSIRETAVRGYVL